MNRPTRPKADSIETAKAICNDCGHLRAAPAARLSGDSRRLRCDHCGRSTKHFPVRSGEGDWRESINLRAVERARRDFDVRVRLDASIALLTSLGIHVAFRRHVEWAALVTRQRGPAGESVTVALNADLPVADQAGHLARAWGLLLPVDETRWLAPWSPDPDTPGQERMTFTWPAR